VLERLLWSFEYLYLTYVAVEDRKHTPANGNKRATRATCSRFFFDQVVPLPVGGAQQADGAASVVSNVATLDRSCLGLVLSALD